MYKRLYGFENESNTYCDQYLLWMWWNFLRRKLVSNGTWYVQEILSHHHVVSTTNSQTEVFHSKKNDICSDGTQFTWSSTDHIEKVAVACLDYKKHSDWNSNLPFNEFVLL